MQKFSKREKKEIVRIGVALVLLIVLAVSERSIALLCCDLLGDYYKLGILCFWLVPYFIVGWDVVRKCVINVLRGNMMDECFLMTLATVGAFACGEYTEAVAVMLFYQVGEFFQRRAVGKSRESIQQLMSIAPDYANRVGEDGELEVIDPDDIEVGDILLIKPGEKIPTDCMVVEGAGLINTSALTGESMLQSVTVGDSVISGCINGDSLIKVQAEKLYDDSTVMQILELVENATSKKSQTENFITRFARVYTPFVVICALILAFIPPIISGNFATEFGTWALRACTFLVISCPCALVISVPLAFFGGIGAASKIGVLVKGSNYLEMMAQLDTVVSDKTGTLTEGKFKVTKVQAFGCDSDEVLRLAAALERGSTHPIALSICEAADALGGKKKVDSRGKANAENLTEIENISGKGIVGKLGRAKIAAGNLALMEHVGAELPESGCALMEHDGAEKPMVNRASGTVVYVAKNDKLIGTIELADAPKDEAKSAIKAMFSEGVKHFVMLTGDSREAAEKVAEELGISEYRAQLLPQDKVAVVEALLAGDASVDGTGLSAAVVGDSASAEADGKLASEGDAASRRVDSNYAGKLAFIGDGINDAPVLARADIGIAMGSLGSDAAIEAADIVIMDDKLMKISMMIRIARQTVRISKANIAFALFVKAACLILGAIGIANMWLAVFADVGVAMICILNSMRMLRYKA